jgi:hypothetical protein
VSASHSIVEIGPTPDVAVGTGSYFDEGRLAAEDLAAACASSVYDLTMHLNPLPSSHRLRAEPADFRRGDLDLGRNISVEASRPRPVGHLEPIRWRPSGQRKVEKGPAARGGGATSSTGAKAPG